MILNREPVAISELIRAVLLCAVCFGFDMSAEQIGAIMLVVGAGLAVFTRQQVTPYYPQNPLLKKGA